MLSVALIPASKSVALYVRLTALQGRAFFVRTSIFGKVLILSSYLTFMNCACKKRMAGKQPGESEISRISPDVLFGHSQGYNCDERNDMTTCMVFYIASQSEIDKRNCRNNPHE